MAISATQMIEKIDEAIVNILVNGQEVATVNGRRFTAADIGDLEKLRAFYEVRAQAETGASNVFNRMVAGIPRR